MMRLLVVVLATLLLCAGCGGGSGGTGKTKQSADRLPEVTLQPLRTNDKPIDLGSLKGPAVVNLWANWCTQCRTEMPIIERFHRTNPGVSVIGVDTRDTQPGLARQVADRAGLTYPLVVDAKSAIPAVGLPRTIFVDASGQIVYDVYGGVKSLTELEDLVKQHLSASSDAGARR